MIDEPYKLIDNHDIFSWSIPFIAERTIFIFHTILKDLTDSELL
jgi:hypothetical protein